MKYIYVVTFFFLSFFVYGQSANSSIYGEIRLKTEDMALDLNNASFTKKNITYEQLIKEYDKIAGSPFLYDQAINVDLVNHTNFVFKDCSVMYDQYQNELVVINKDQKAIILDQRFYKGFIYKNEGKKEFYKRLATSDNNFYHVLFAEGDFVFCKTNKVGLVKNNRRVVGLDLPDQKFIKRTKYFIFKKDKGTLVSLRKGDLFDYFPSKYAEQVNRLQKELKVKKLRKEEDYLKIINAFKKMN